MGRWGQQGALGDRRRELAIPRLEPAVAEETATPDSEPENAAESAVVLIVADFTAVAPAVASAAVA